MQKWIIGLLALTAIGMAWQMIVGSGVQAAPETAKPGVLRHVVLFKFKDSATPEQVKQIEQAFAALPGKISEIIDYEWGTDVGVENLSSGFTHCFFVTFRDAQGRDSYLPHTAHKEFVELLKPHLDKVCVVDYFAKR
jgi:hypothetical protein